jgi:hypothetical protein
MPTSAPILSLCATRQGMRYCCAPCAMLSYCAWSYLPQTVALSNITIFSGAIANMMFNLPRKHPFKAGPIIDYDLLLLVRACFRGGEAGRTSEGQIKEGVSFLWHLQKQWHVDDRGVGSWWTKWLAIGVSTGSLHFTSRPTAGLHCVVQPAVQPQHTGRVQYSLTALQTMNLTTCGQ